MLNTDHLQIDVETKNALQNFFLYHINYIYYTYIYLFLYDIQGYEQPPAAAGDEGLVLQEVGMSEEITNKIQARADILTNERKRRGKTVPEGLATTEDISNYRQLASHTVSIALFGSNTS